MAAARAEGIDASGPFAPDTVFMRARASQGRPGEFDVVVAMYHDQGLIPVKYLGVADGKWLGVPACVGSQIKGAKTTASLPVTVLDTAAQPIDPLPEGRDHIVFL